MMTASGRRPKLTLSGVLTSLWHNRVLVWRLTRREIEARYSGTVLGILWPLLTSLALLTIYTFMFGVVFKSRWDIGEEAGTLHFSVILFTGLIIFNLFGDCVIRSPGLVLENVVYVKKVIFPLEILPWVSFLHVLFNSAMAATVLTAAVYFIFGAIPVTAVAFPLLLVPVCFMAMGLSWALAALGVFLRDIRHLIGLLVTALMFLSPIFYPVSLVPVDFRWVVELNPLAPIITSARDCLIYGHWPDWGVLALTTLCAYAAAWVGYAGFMLAKKGFADVL